MDPYLLGLRLRDRRVVVVGGGAVASRRIPALLDAGAEILLVSPKATASLEDLAAAGRIRWAARGYSPGDCAGAWLVCACADAPAVNQAVAAAAEAQQTWCVRADDAEASGAWTPASGQAGDVRIGVLSGDPRHSAAIRDAVLAGLRSGQLSARHERGRRAGVAIIGGGPGDPGLITVRGRQLLAEADVVLADRLAPRVLLDELRDDVEIIDASKIPYGRAMAQEHINSALISHARAGRFVARLKGGDPFVFGRGAEEVLACLRAGVPVTVVPGVTSAVAVPASAWVPVTHRGVAQDFHVVSVHRQLGAHGRQFGHPGPADGGGADRRGGGRTTATRTQCGYSRFGNRRRYPSHAAHNQFDAGTSGRRGGTRGHPAARDRRGRRRRKRRRGNYGTYARCNRLTKRINSAC
jgi:uroporphyrin-III C-methyltransferase/precorrin-2 dehydrogenase/sirohydrochlorin ferrochelatase